MLEYARNKKKNSRRKKRRGKLLRRTFVSFDMIGTTSGETPERRQTRLAKGKFGEILRTNTGLQEKRTIKTHLGMVEAHR